MRGALVILVGRSAVSCFLRGGRDGWIRAVSLRRDGGFVVIRDVVKKYMLNIESDRSRAILTVAHETFDGG